MKSSHTPGPWHWDGNTLLPVHPDFNRSDVHSILSADGGYGFLGSKHSDTQRELEADRVLIQAAPQLLKALQCLLRDHEAVHGIGDLEMQPALYQARAAIADATRPGDWASA